LLCGGGVASQHRQPTGGGGDADAGGGEVEEVAPGEAILDFGFWILDWGHWSYLI
jgi:hypothetical protein